MTGPTNAAADLFAAIRREVTAELGKRPGDRTPERIFAATAHRLALEAPDLFLALRHGVHRRRDKEGRIARTILDEIHGELWEQPPFTSDRVINLSLDANYGPIRGRPRKGSLLRQLDDSELETARRRLDALTLHLNAELAGEHWHGYGPDDADGPAIDLGALEKKTKKALAAAFRHPSFDISRNLATPSRSVEAEPPDVVAVRKWHKRFGAAACRKLQVAVDGEVSAVIKETVDEMVRERYGTPRGTRTRARGTRLHRPQEWAARALLRLMGQAEPIPWPDASALIKDLTRDARPVESEPTP